MTRKRSNTARVSTANALLEAVAQASGGGWFTDRQQKRLRLLLRCEYSDLTDAGLLYDDVQLDNIEHDSELSCFPNGNRPNHESDEDTPAEIEVEEVEIGPLIKDGPPDDPPESTDPLSHPNCRVISVD